jgi:hypothetical protein
MGRLGRVGHDKLLSGLVSFPPPRAPTGVRRCSQPYETREKTRAYEVTSSPLSAKVCRKPEKVLVSILVPTRR